MSKNAHPHDRVVTVVAGAMLVGASWGVAGSARAEGEAIYVTFDAPPSCPSKDRFEAEIGARTTLARFSADSSGARVFRASIHQAAGSYEGELSTLADGVEGEPRRVRDARCDDVASALALMIAIAVDPRASTAPVAALAVSAPQQAPPPAPASSAVPLSPPASRPSVRSSLSPPTWSWAAGMDVLTLGGIAPEVSLGVNAFAETSHATAGAFRFALGYADNTPFAGASRDATMRWLGGRVEACPAGALLPRSVRVLACGGVELGAQQARGDGAPHPRTETRWASSVELGGRVQWWPTHALFLEAGAGARIPLLRRTFVFEGPRQVIYQMPWVGWSAAFGGGLRFL